MKRHCHAMKSVRNTLLCSVALYVNVRIYVTTCMLSLCQYVCHVILAGTASVRTEYCTSLCNNHPYHTHKLVYVFKVVCVRSSFITVLVCASPYMSNVHVPPTSLCNVTPYATKKPAWSDNRLPVNRLLQSQLLERNTVSPLEACSWRS